MNTGVDLKENLKQAKELIERACDRGATLICLPEYFNCMGTDIIPETLDGPSITMIRKAAQEKNVWINCGSFTEENPNGHPFNTSVFVNSNGEVAAVYRKLHLFDNDLNGIRSYESDTRSAGDKIVTVNSPHGKLGMSICYDIRFPELYRLMALQGAKVLFAPANFLMNTGKDHWEPILQTRAIENGCYVIAPCQTGKKVRNISLGKSIIVDPWGNVIAKSNEGVCVATAEIDFSYLENIRQQIPSLKNRRDDVYKIE